MNRPTSRSKTSWGLNVQAANWRRGKVSTYWHDVLHYTMYYIRVIVSVSNVSVSRRSRGVFSNVSVSYLPRDS